MGKGFRLEPVTPKPEVGVVIVAAVGADDVGVDDDDDDDSPLLVLEVLAVVGLTPW